MIDRIYNVPLVCEDFASIAMLLYNVTTYWVHVPITYMAREF